MNTITLTKEQKAKINRALKALEDVRRDVQTSPENKANPIEGINWYLEDCGNLCLMNGPTHGKHDAPQYDNVIESFNFPESSGGGW
jgi:hypothetical protein